MTTVISPQPLAVGETKQNIQETTTNVNHKQSYTDLFKPSKSDASSSKLELRPVHTVQGEPTVEFTVEEVNAFTIEEGLHQAVIVKFSYGKPDLQELRQLIPKLFNVKGNCNIGQLEYRHILIRFDLFDDFVQVLSRTTGFVKAKGDDFFYRTFPWTMGFNPREETSKAVVWISMPDLPTNLFAKKALMSIAAAVGKPLAVDKATQDRTRPSTARVKVLLDLLDKHPKKVRINIGDVNSGKVIEYYQEIVYDNLPKYCSICKHQGHNERSCRWRIENSKVTEVDVNEGEDLGIQGDTQEGSLISSHEGNMVEQLQGDARDYLNTKRAGLLEVARSEDLMQLGMKTNDGFQQGKELLESVVGREGDYDGQGVKEVVAADGQGARENIATVAPIVTGLKEVCTNDNRRLQWCIVPSSTGGPFAATMAEKASDRDDLTVVNNVGHLDHMNDEIDIEMGDLGTVSEQQIDLKFGVHQLKEKKVDPVRHAFDQQHVQGLKVGDNVSVQHIKILKENKKGLDKQCVAQITDPSFNFSKNRTKDGNNYQLEEKEVGHLGMLNEQQAVKKQQHAHGISGKLSNVPNVGQFCLENGQKYAHGKESTLHFHVSSTNLTLGEHPIPFVDFPMTKIPVGIIKKANNAAGNEQHHTHAPTIVVNSLEQINDCDAVLLGQRCDEKKNDEEAVHFDTIGTPLGVQCVNNVHGNLGDVEKGVFGPSKLKFSSPQVEQIIKDTQLSMMLNANPLMKQPLVTLNKEVIKDRSQAIREKSNEITFRQEEQVDDRMMPRIKTWADRVENWDNGVDDELISDHDKTLLDTLGSPKPHRSAYSTGSKTTAQKIKASMAKKHEPRSEKKLKRHDPLWMVLQDEINQKLEANLRIASSHEAKEDELIESCPEEATTIGDLSPKNSEKMKVAQEITLRQLPMRAAKQKGVAISTSMRSNKSDKK